VYPVKVGTALNKRNLEVENRPELNLRSVVPSAVCTLACEPETAIVAELSLSTVADAAEVSSVLFSPTSKLINGDSIGVPIPVNVKLST
jgi:hypothetical protein